MLLVLEEATPPAPFTDLVYPPTGIPWTQGLSQHESPHTQPPEKLGPCRRYLVLHVCYKLLDGKFSMARK